MENKLAEKIDAYLLGKLSKADNESFVEELAQNPTLVRKVSEQKKILQAVALHQEMAIRDQMAEWAQQVKPDGNTRGKLTKWGIGIATLLILVGLLFFFLTKKEKPTPETIYANYYQIPDLVNSRTRIFGQPIDTLTPKQDLLLELSISAYQKQDFQQANEYLQQYFSTTSPSSEAKYYAANLHMHRGEYNQALAYYLEIENSTELHSHDRDQIKLNIAIVYVQLNKYENAQNKLQNALSDPLFDFPSLARKLLADIDAMKE